MNKLSHKDIADAICSDTDATRGQFLTAFPAPIKEFTDALCEVYDRLADLDTLLPRENKRSALVEAYMFNASNSLLTSFHLLINGFQIPSGNLVRQWFEALAMALLCCDSRIDTFDKLEANAEQFSVQKGPNLIMREKNARILGIRREIWPEIQKSYNFYHKFSHPSVLSLASMFLMSGKGEFIIGSEFDTGKVKAYEKEFSFRIDACKLSLDVIPIVQDHLLQK